MSIKGVPRMLRKCAGIVEGIDRSSEDTAGRA